MAKIDHTIYSQMRAPDILGGFMDGYSQGQQIRDANEKRQKQQDLSNAMKSGIITNADGSKTFDPNKTYQSLLGGGFTSEAEDLRAKDLSQQQAQQKLTQDKLNQTLQFFGNARAAIKKDPSQYPILLQEAKKSGMDISTMPPTWGPVAEKALNFYEGRLLTIQQRMDQENKDRDFTLREKDLVSRALDRKDAQEERRFQTGLKQDEKEQALKTPYGLANTTDDAKQLKEAHEAKVNFDSKLQEMINLRKEKEGGALWDREAVARGKQLSRDLLLEYKNMAKLGVLSKSDEDIINAIIPKDPLAYDWVPGQDPILSNLEKFKASSDVDFQNRVKTRTRAGIDTAASSLEKVIDGVTYVKVEGGWLPKK